MVPWSMVEVQSSQYEYRQTDARDWRRRCRVPLRDSGTSSSDCAVGRTGHGTGLLRVAALVGVLEPNYELALHEYHDTHYGSRFVNKHEMSVRGTIQIR